MACRLCGLSGNRATMRPPNRSSNQSRARKGALPILAATALLTLAAVALLAQEGPAIFRREDVPVSLGLIIDNSGSMRDKRSKVEAAALALVKDSNPDDEVFVVNFNDEAFLDNPHGKDFTSNIKEMEEALTRIDSRGGTAMRDAIRMSIDHLKEKGKKEKKVLVVVTDGNDNSSVISLENLVKSSQQSEVLIYAVGLLSEEERREAKRAERALAD